MVRFLSNWREPAGSFPLASLLFSVITLFDTANAISLISGSGAKLFDGDGNQFFIKGVFYEVDPDDDALAATDQCKIDAPIMKDLGINTIRVRNIDTSGSGHDGCMSAFEDAGIYVLVHLHGGTSGISTSNPSWNEFLFNSFSSVIDTYAKYDNLLGLIFDNVKTDAAGPESGPYIKAAISDMKAYRDSKSYRNFLIGYIEGVGTDSSLGQYLSCGDPKHAPDLYGFNGDGSYCSSNSDASDALNDFATDASEFNIPVFEGNAGCSDTDVLITQIEATLDGSISSVISGGSIYTWGSFDDASNPHLVTFPGDDFDDKPVTPKKNNPFYSDYQSALKSSTPSTTAQSAYSVQTSFAPCPSSDGDWAAALDRSLPTLADSLISTTAAPSGTNTASAGQSAASDTMQPAESSSGLSTGAKAAIGVVIPVVVIIAAVAFFFLYRRRKQQKRQRAQELANMGSDLPKKDPPAQVLYEKDQPDQLPPRPELEQPGLAAGHHPTRELEGHTFVGELEDTSQPTAGERGNVSH